MRGSPTVLLAVSLLAPLAFGSGSAGTTDPVGDQRWGVAVPAGEGMPATDPCHDPASDLTAQSIALSGDVVTYTVSVADEDGEAFCADPGAPLGRTHANGRDYIVPSGEEWYLYTDLVSSASPFQDCGAVWVYGVGNSACLGAITLVGDTWTWTFPASGTVHVTNLFGGPDVDLTYHLAGEVTLVAETYAYLSQGFQGSAVGVGAVTFTDDSTMTADL